ncbi:MAG TPA: Hpt domain-containing protein [Candidatus Ozemobacteraceae bacterium]|nr:Hpt domain-containing protein [Candidatus Ozemobacteraceae bacterium]
MNEELNSVFLESAKENLAELEEALLKLESESGNQNEIDRVFRVMHTIKGSAAMVGFEEVSEFAHELENEFQHIRAGEIQVSKALINYSLSARDQLLAMIEERYSGGKADMTRCKEILAGFRRETLDHHEIQFQKKRCLMKERLNALEAALESWTEGQTVDSTMSHFWSEALETAISSKMECLSEFLTGFESFFSLMARVGDSLSAEALRLAKGGVDEANNMLTAMNDQNAASIDPVEVIESLKNAFDLKSDLDRQAAKYLGLRQQQSMKRYHIRISGIQANTPGSSGMFYLDILRNLGHCAILNVRHEALGQPEHEQELAAG